MSSKLGEAFLAIIPKVDAAAMSGAMSSITSTLGGAAKTGAAAFGVMSAAATAAAGVLVKSSLDGYAAYEQNVGGIQKLFGNMGKSLDEYASMTGQTTEQASGKWQELEVAQTKMMSQAKQAFATCGLSANAYMEQVTSFSAALISSLGGDTVKAADYADMAMVDMADNANTFGTSIGDIQNAYQGFAKQNYTMLDNLKLGYGGTQQEMQRLISDASKMTDVQQKLGVTVDSSSMSFDNIVAAIHVMQESMQIGGTTAREASTTIEGSVSAMKAAWDNWLVGLGDDSANISDLTGQLVDSAVIAASNIVPRVSEIVGTLVGELPSMVSQIGPVLAEAVGTIVTSAMDSLRDSLGEDNPIVGTIDSISVAIDRLSEGVSPLTALYDAFSEIGSMLGLSDEQAGAFAGTMAAYLIPAIETGQVIVQTLVDAFTNAGTSISENLQPALDAFLPVWQSINDLIQAAVPFITQIIGDVISLAGSILEAAMPAIASIVETVSTALPLIQTIWNTVFPVIQTVTETVFGVVSSVIQTVMSVIQQVISVVLSAINGDWSGAWAGIQGILEGAWDNIKTAVSVGIEGVLGFMRDLPGNILGAIGNVGELLWNAGTSIISGFLDGLKQKFEDVKSFVGGIGDWIAEHKGPIPYDLKLLVPNGMAIMESLHTGLERGFGPVADLVGGFADSISSELSGAMSVPDAGVSRLAASAKLARSAVGGAGWSAASRQTVVNQTFSTKVVRADADLYAAAPTIYRNAMREARAYA